MKETVCVEDMGNPTSHINAPQLKPIGCAVIAYLLLYLASWPCSDRAI